MRIFIIHGYSADVEAHWFPWLAEQLTAQGHRVSIVELPTPTAPVRQEWDARLAAEIGTVDEDTLLIAHSLGTITALRFLSGLESGWRLGGFVSVAGFLGRLSVIPEIDNYLADSPEVAALAARIDVRTMIYSDNDEVVPSTASRTLAELLGAEQVVVPGGGHFLADDGFTELPEVLAAAEEVARQRR
ncbi:RBBP9/YdeN family alpha/beta hydrolase [Nocardia wallacei]|uniref:RBBP9/YdeN family alpha/beta hydrolase n=1 Tax=Nocardia wallacei TaxID=480035 RepID=UPI002457BDDA|nr:alpha/beta hydrolase [Nocardia wallacei]